MSKKLSFLFAMVIFQMAFSQVGIQTSSPNTNSDLTPGSTNKGLLLNNVALTGTSSASPLAAHVAGMTVYNTATAGDVTPGIYYNDGAKWVRTSSGATVAATEPWYNVSGNVQATANTQDIYQMGKVGVNTSTPGSTLEVNGSFGTNFNSVTSSTYTMAYGDYYVGYNGSANATFTMPTGASGTCKCEGRTYEIYNNTAYTVTVNPVSGETFPNGLTSIALTPNTSLKVVNTNSASGNTWDIIFFGSTLPPKGTFAPYVTLAGYNNTDYGIAINSSGADGGIPLVPLTNVSVNDGNLTAGSTWYYYTSGLYGPYWTTNYYTFPSSGFYQVTGTMQYGFQLAVNASASPYNYAFAIQPMFIRLNSNGLYQEQIAMGANISNLPHNYSVNYASNWYSASNSITKYFNAGDKIGVGAQLCGGCAVNGNNIVTYRFKNANMVVLKLFAN